MSFNEIGDGDGDGDGQSGNNDGSLSVYHNQAIKELFMPQGNTSTKMHIPLAAFMKWPLAKRQDFIKREMPGSPDFIKAPLLRH